MGGGRISLVGAVESAAAGLDALDPQAFQIKPEDRETTALDQSTADGRSTGRQEEQQRRRIYGHTKPGYLLKHHIPVKTDSWDDSRKSIGSRIPGIRAKESGARWQDLPEEYPHPSTCWRRLRDWEEQGVVVEQGWIFLPKEATGGGRRRGLSAGCVGERRKKERGGKRRGVGGSGAACCSTTRGEGRVARSATAATARRRPRRCCRWRHR